MSITLLILLKTLLWSVPITAVIVFLIFLINRYTESDVESRDVLIAILTLFTITCLITHGRVSKHELADKTLVHFLYSSWSQEEEYLNNTEIPETFSKYRGRNDVFVNKTNKTLVIYNVGYSTSRYDSDKQIQYVAKIILPEEFFFWSRDKYNKMFEIPPRSQVISVSRRNHNTSYTFTYLDYLENKDVQKEVGEMIIMRYNE